MCKYLVPHRFPHLLDLGLLFAEGILEVILVHGRKSVLVTDSLIAVLQELTSALKIQLVVAIAIRGFFAALGLSPRFLGDKNSGVVPLIFRPLVGGRLFDICDKY